MHKWLPNLVAKFWLPNLVLYQIVDDGSTLVQVKHGAYRHQAITWAKVDPVQWCHVVPLTHWGWVMHKCVSKLTISGSDNGLSPGGSQAIISTNAAILLTEPLGTKFGEILMEIHTFSVKKMHLKMLFAIWRPFCLSFNVLSYGDLLMVRHQSHQGNSLRPSDAYMHQ